MWDIDYEIKIVSKMSKKAFRDYMINAEKEKKVNNNNKKNNHSPVKDK